MVFLIEYNRKKGSIVTFERFQNVDRVKAQRKRLELELHLNEKNIGHEVVLLEAANEGLLRKTHRRYFETLRSIATSTGQ